MMGDFTAIHRHLLPVFQHRQEKPGSETPPGAFRRGPVRQVGELVGADREARLLPRFADGGVDGGAVVIAVRGIVGLIHPAAGKYPDAPHVGQRLVALHQQSLQPLRAVAHQHHSRGGVYRLHCRAKLQHDVAL